MNGDDAYACHEQMVTPYPGKGLSIDKDGFNFYQSKVRISVACVFGMLHARCGILWKPTSIRLDKVPTLVCAIVKLNNMCISDMVGSRYVATMDTACLGGLLLLIRADVSCRCMKHQVQVQGAI